jgi:hypothetical protein
LTYSGCSNSRCAARSDFVSTSSGWTSVKIFRSLWRNSFLADNSFARTPLVSPTLALVFISAFSGLTYR